MPELSETNTWHWKGYVVATLTAVMLTIPLRIYVARPFIVSGASMQPTFNSREYLVIDELTYRIHSPKRGDVIVMRYPLDESKFFIKRVVGLPGEVVSIRDGHVSILGKDGGVNEILNEPYASSEAKKEFQVAKLADNEYFVMGDNREESSDSRVWGPLPKKYIVGRAIARLYPFSRTGILPGQYSF